MHNSFTSMMPMRSFWFTTVAEITMPLSSMMTCVCSRDEPPGFHIPVFNCNQIRGALSGFSDLITQR